MGSGRSLLERQPMITLLLARLVGEEDMVD